MSVLVASLSGPGFELQEIVFSAGLILSGHKALKILYLWKLNPFPSRDVYGLLECWASGCPSDGCNFHSPFPPGLNGPCHTGSTGPFMPFHKEQGLKLLVPGATSAGCPFLASWPPAERPMLALQGCCLTEVSEVVCF